VNNHSPVSSGRLSNVPVKNIDPGSTRDPTKPDTRRKRLLLRERAASIAALASSLPPYLRTLPGVPLPRNARERARDWRRRVDGWHGGNGIALRFYTGGTGGRDELAALAGAALAVFLANYWIETVLDLEEPSEREQLFWGTSLPFTRNGEG
jgi:hypothetical protein